MTYNISLQPGHIARHTPRGAGSQGREAAVIDIAQDLLLRHLADEGLLNLFAIKGGTALRKLYAGNEGRFSLDLDFAVADISADRDEAALEFSLAVDGLEIGPFRYGITERRGKPSVMLSGRFVTESTLQTKLDFSAAPWLPPVSGSWVPMPVHAQYGGSLPSIKAVRLEENLAEKIARLNRVTTARDMYDLAWIAGNGALWRHIDQPLVRRLSVLKIWVDANGLHAGATCWAPAHAGLPFNPSHWLRKRDAKEFDIEDIGALAVPTPKPEELSERVRKSFAFLQELDDEERIIANASGKDRALAIHLLENLPGGRLSGAGLY